MQIEQYHRRELPIGSAGNVIARQPNSYAELGRLGETMTEIGFAMEEQRLQAQYHDEMNAAKLQADKDFLDFQESLDPNNTEDWPKNLETKQQAFNFKFKNGKAQNDFGVWREQENLRQKSSILAYRRQVDARNATANFGINYKQSAEIASKAQTNGEYQQSILGTLDTLFELELKDTDKPIGPDNLKIKEGANNPLFQPDELRIAKGAEWLSYTQELREATRKKAIGEFLVEEAVAVDDNTIIDDANRVAQSEGFEETFFTKEDIAGLKSKVRAIKNIAEGEKNARAEVFDRDTRKKILAGGPVLPTLRDEILNNPDLNGPQMNTLINLYDKRVGGAGTKYTNEQKLAAYAEIVEEDEPAKKLQLLFKHANAFTPEKAQSLYDSINNPKSSDIEDSSAGKFLKNLIDQAGFGTDVTLVATQRGYMLLKDAIDSAEKPLTNDEKKQKVLELFNNLKEDVNAGKIDVHPVSLKKLREPGEVPLGLTLGLQEIWDQLDDASKLAAVNLLARGATPEQLIAHFKKKTGK